MLMAETQSEQFVEILDTVAIVDDVQHRAGFIGSVNNLAHF